jgi:lipopolysaccharide transport system permease protein
LTTTSHTAVAESDLGTEATPGLTTSSSRVMVVEPVKQLIPISPRTLWRYRELFYFLVWRDIKVRYAQTALGAAWMLFQPLAMMLVYTFAFSHLAKVTIPGVPYPLFALSGLTVWIFVSRGVVIGSESIVQNIPIVTKTSSPRLLLPLAAVVAVLVDFVIALVLFLVIAALYGRFPTWRFVFVPPLLLVIFALTFGISAFLSATNVRYRDVGQALPFIVTLWFFLSPVAYQLQTPGHSWETLIQALNPLVGLIVAFRWALLGTAAPRGLLAVAVLISIAILVVGLLRFGRLERTLPDDV